MFRKLAVSAAAITFFSLTAAFAQDAPAGGPAQMGHHWQKPSPEDMAAWHKQMCDDHFARAAGRLAFVEAKLDVTEAQRPLFNRWRDEIMHNAAARKDACLAHQHVPGEHPTILERETMMQKHLEDRLAALRAEEPALDALYQSLTPEQKAELDSQHRGHGFGHHHGGMMMHRGDDAHG